MTEPSVSKRLGIALQDLPSTGEEICVNRENFVYRAFFYAKADLEVAQLLVGLDEPQEWFTEANLHGRFEEIMASLPSPARFKIK